MNKLLTHFLTFICIISLLPCTANATDHEQGYPPILAQLAKNNMRAFEWADQDWPNERFEPFVLRCMRYTKEMQPFRKRKCAFDILKRHYASIPSTTAHVLDDLITWNDLGLFHGDEASSPYLAQIVDRSFTEIGRVTLAFWIANPTDDSELLKKRQRVVKKIIANDGLLADLEKQFSLFARSENYLLSFWINDPLKQACERSYFSFGWAKEFEESLNQSENMLFAKALFDHQWRATFCLSTVSASCLLPFYGLKQLLSSEDYGTFDTVSERLIGVGGGMPMAMLSTMDNRAVKASTGVASGALCYMMIGDSYEWMKGNFTLSKCLQEKLCHVKRSVHAMRAIENMAYHVGLDAELDVIHDLKDVALSSESKLAYLLVLLEAETFANEPSLLSHWGRILVSYRLMHELHQEFEKALCALGEIDAYVSIARLYKEFEHEKVHYSFAEYDTHSDKPLIELEGFWNPFVSPARVVTNTLSIGLNHPRNLVITGPNAGGKSTAIKAIGMNLILAQSIGIAPAARARITPFSYIATYLNITDDIAAGKSLFKAQVCRAKELMESVKAMPSDKYSFLAIDEMFNGTDVRVGQALSFSVAKELGKQTTNIAILATHFPLLTKLEQEGDFANYHVKAMINESGNVIYPFTLDVGVSGQSVALDMMQQEGFSSAVIDEARMQLESVA